jgi:hypothetical protein
MFMSRYLITAQASGLRHYKRWERGTFIPSIWAPLMTRQIYRLYSTYIHVILSILRVTIPTASLLRAISAKTIVFNLPVDVLHVHTKKKKKKI